MSINGKDEATTTSEIIEVMKIGDHEANVLIKGEGKNQKILVEAPEGLEDDPVFAEQAQKAKSALALANKKGYETNQEKKRLEEEKQAIAREREAFAKEQAEWAIQKEMKFDPPDVVDLMMKNLGVDEEDLNELPRTEYTRAERKAMSEINNLEKKHSRQTQLLSKFMQNGGNVKELRAFADSLGAEITPALINTFTKTNQPLTPQFTTKTLADMQKTQIHVVPKGTIASKVTPRVKVEKQLDDTMLGIMDRL